MGTAASAVGPGAARLYLPERARDRRIPLPNHRNQDCGREEPEHEAPVDHKVILQPILACHGHEHCLPRKASHASQTMNGVIAIAATGSAHPIPKNACAANPSRAMIDR